MNDHVLLSRRRFLGAVAGLAGSLLLPASSEASGYYRAIRYVPDHGFNRDQLAILGQAVNILAQRMLDPRMLGYTIPRYRYYQVHAPSRRFATARDFEGWVHNIQMQALRVCGFPQLNLYGRPDARGGWTGRAPVGTVMAEYASVGSAPARFFTRGTFTVTLNTALLGANTSYGRDPAYWAGTICHEMLHNLGHDHPVGVYDGIFIRVYETAVWRNAT